MFGSSKTRALIFIDRCASHDSEINLVNRQNALGATLAYLRKSIGVGFIQGVKFSNLDLSAQFDLKTQGGQNWAEMRRVGIADRGIHPMLLAQWNWVGWGETVYCKFPMVEILLVESFNH